MSHSADLGSISLPAEAEGPAALLSGRAHRACSGRSQSVASGPCRGAHENRLARARAASVSVAAQAAGAKAGSPTMPGNEATSGYKEFHRMVTGARVSVTCATYNFHPVRTCGKRCAPHRTSLGESDRLRRR